MTLPIVALLIPVTTGIRPLLDEVRIILAALVRLILMISAPGASTNAHVLPASSVLILLATVPTLEFFVRWKPTDEDALTPQSACDVVVTLFRSTEIDLAQLVGELICVVITITTARRPPRGSLPIGGLAAAIAWTTVTTVVSSFRLSTTGAITRSLVPRRHILVVIPTAGGAGTGSTRNEA